MLCEKVIGKLSELQTENKKIEYVDIEWHEAFKKIHRKIGSEGSDIGIRMGDEILKRGLFQDDVIYDQDGVVVVVNTPPCEVLVVTIKPGHEKWAAKVCYEIGNRHAPLFWGENGTFITIFNEPMFVLLQNIHGAEVRREVRKLNFNDRISAAIHNHQH